MIESQITEKETEVFSQPTALMIIDMQNDAMSMVPSGKEIIPTIKRVLDVAREKEIPIIHKNRIQRSNGIDVERFRIDLFQDAPFLIEGSNGAKIVKDLEPTKKEIVVTGARFSGFFQTDLQLILTRLGVKTLVMCGIQTPNCIRATVTDAIAYDYDVVLLNDAISAQTTEIHNANLLDMKNMGVTILSTSNYLNSVD